MSTFVRNQWYVAAHSREIGRELMHRTILGEPIALYRTRSGAVVGLADRCVHRRYPLSAAPSRLVDDTVVCGYHGFTYDGSGACVAVPGQIRIPRTARVTSYPIAEQDSFVWVWIGDAALADPADIPRAPWLADANWATVSGMEPIAGRWSLLVDNLMDLSHETYLHAGYIGTPEVASTPITTEVDDQQRVVRVSRHMDNAECPPFYATSTGISGRITRWQDIEYRPPCLYVLHSRVAPVGVLPNPDGTDPHAFHVEVVYAITPSTEHSTLDFWNVARDFALDDEQVSVYLHDSNRTVVLQDVTALELLETVLASDPPGAQELSINIDTGALAARRMIAALSATAGTSLPVA